MPRVMAVWPGLPRGVIDASGQHGQTIKACCRRRWALELRPSEVGVPRVEPTPTAGVSRPRSLTRPAGFLVFTRSRSGVALLAQGTMAGNDITDGHAEAGERRIFIVLSCSVSAAFAVMRDAR